MGVSTNGILFYGIHYDEGEPVGEDGETINLNEWEDALAERMGLKPPAVKYDAKNEAVKAAYCNYWTEKRELVEGADCVIDTHCMGDYPMYFVALRGTVKVAYRGTPEPAGLDLPHSKEEADARIRAFCELMGLPVHGAPQWWLTSYWG